MYKRQQMQTDTDEISKTVDRYRQQQRQTGKNDSRGRQEQMTAGYNGKNGTFMPFRKWHKCAAGTFMPCRAVKNMPPTYLTKKYTKT